MDEPEPAPAPAKKTKQPKYSRITQQELRAQKAHFGPMSVLFTFFSTGAALLVLGGVTLAYGLRPVEYSVRYDGLCMEAQAGAGTTSEAAAAFLAANAQDEAKLACTFEIKVEQDVPGPVYLWYELDSLYQNHRRYVRSRNDMAMAGETWTSADQNLCKPLAYKGGLASQPILPCGLLAWSLFNDTYALQRKPSGGAASPLAVSEKGIAHPADLKARYADDAYPAHFNAFGQSAPVKGGSDLSRYENGAWVGQTLREDEHLAVWMRNAAQARFRKLWGRVSGSLAAGDTITVTVANRYNSYKFGGAKRLVLGNTTWLGGRNPFLGAANLAAGGLSVALGLAFLAARIARPRKMGDVTRLSFYNSPAGAH